jgi:hypothetical protein
MHGIKLVNDLCTLPEFAAVGIILGPVRQWEVVIESLSGPIASLFPGTREI